MPKTLQIALGLHQSGNLAEAERLYRQVLAAEPDNADALYLLGVIAQQKGMHESAVDLIEKAHRLQSPTPDSLDNLGKAYLGLNRHREAKKCFSRALAQKPDYAEAHNGLGNALTGLRQLKEAAASYRRALALNPAYAEAQFNLANVLGELGELEGAARSYREALAVQPDMHEAHLNLGVILHDLGRTAEAEQCYRRALALKPDLAEALYNLGGALKELGRTEEAEQSLREALALRPDIADAHYDLGNVLADLGRLEEAERSYRRALALEPDRAEARWALTMLQLPAVRERDGDPDAGRSAFLRELRNLSAWFNARSADEGQKAVGVQQPFYLAYQESNNRDLYREYGELCARLMRRWVEGQRFSRARRAAANSLRVGIVSAHIHDHPVWNAIIKGWLEHLDRKRFDLLVFHLGMKQDQETSFARSRAARFEEGGKDLRGWVQGILAQQPDVLIYPEIGMDSMTLKLASLRLAPIQAASWGHPVTTGLPTIDYYLSADDLEPADAEEHYTERLVRLPGLGCCYQSLPVSPQDPDLGSLGIEPPSPMFICPGTPYKYTPQYDRVFTDIARRIGRCRFVFFTSRQEELSGKLRRRLVEEFARAGMDFESYGVFIPWQPRPAFYGLMRRADAYLDTIGFSGFNSAMQALECGLPVVTREGRFMRGKFASGILRRLGLQELVAATEGDYVALAMKLATDADYRRELRQRIEASRPALYDDPAPVRALEQFLIGALDRR